MIATLCTDYLEHARRRQFRLFAAAIPWYDGAHLWISGDCLVPLDDYWLVAKKLAGKISRSQKMFAGKISRSPDSLLTTIVSKSLAE